MIINLIIVSKACWDIIASTEIVIQDTDSPLYLELLEQIYDMYPKLNPDTDFKLFWQRSPQDVMVIENWISFNTYLKMMANNTIYLLVNDVDKNYEDTRRFLRELDEVDKKIEKEKKRSKYDVVMPSRKAFGCRCSLVNVIEEPPDEDTDYTVKEIIFHAIRNEAKPKCLSADLVARTRMVECVKKGWPHERKTLDIARFESDELEAKLKKQR